MLVMDGPPDSRKRVDRSPEYVHRTLRRSADHRHDRDQRVRGRRTHVAGDRHRSGGCLRRPRVVGTDRRCVRRHGAKLSITAIVVDSPPPIDPCIANARLRQEGHIVGRVPRRAGTMPPALPGSMSGSNWLPCVRFYGAGPCRSGATVGTGVRRRSAITAWGSSRRCVAVRMREVRIYWVCAPRQERLPPQTLRVTTAGRMACSARQLVASMAGLRRK